MHIAHLCNALNNVWQDVVQKEECHPFNNTFKVLLENDTLRVIVCVSLTYTDISCSHACDPHLHLGKITAFFLELHGITAMADIWPHELLQAFWAFNFNKPCRAAFTADNTVRTSPKKWPVLQNTQATVVNLEVVVLFVLWKICRFSNCFKSHLFANQPLLLCFLSLQAWWVLEHHVAPFLFGLCEPLCRHYVQLMQ